MDKKERKTRTHLVQPCLKPSFKYINFNILLIISIILLIYYILIDCTSHPAKI